MEKENTTLTLSNKPFVYIWYQLIVKKEQIKNAYYAWKTIRFQIIIFPQKTSVGERN